MGLPCAFEEASADRAIWDVPAQSCLSEVRFDSNKNTTWSVDHGRAATVRLSIFMFAGVSDFLVPGWFQIWIWGVQPLVSQWLVGVLQTICSLHPWLWEKTLLGKTIL